MKIFAFCLAAFSQAFYLPGVVPRDYADGEPVEIKVNKLESSNSLLTFDYYSLAFCEPEKIQVVNENIGEILSGDRIENSGYQVYMQQSEKCKILCKQTLDPDQIKKFAKRIKQGYRANWILDNIPAGTAYVATRDDTSSYDVMEKGFSVGFVTGEKGAKVPYLHNHHRLVISTHQDPTSYEGYRIVGFQVEAHSVKHKFKGKWKGASTKLSSCSASTLSTTKQAISTLKNGDEIIFTYDIEWKDSDVKWASRWDLYLKSNETGVHWFSIVNSIIVVICMAGFIGSIVFRALSRDLKKYNEVSEDDDDEDESGWKLVHADVFRAPKHGALLSVLIGSGVQMFAMALVTLIFALFGFLSPANRGSLMSAALVMFVLMGVFAGYFSTRVYKMFQLSNWKRNTLWTALLVPGVVFTSFFFLNLLVWGQKSTGAVPFGTLVALLVLWFGVSVPLVYLGSYLAFRKEAIAMPLRVSNIPRSIPDLPFSLKTVPACLIAGILPFGAVSLEVVFIMSSVWSHQFYYMFGFLAIVFVLLVVNTAQVGIAFCYITLYNEDYHWWWRSFWIGSSTGFYLFLYGIYFFFQNEIATDSVAVVVYFTYMALASSLLGLLTGTVGYFACYYFVNKMYCSLKVD